MPTLADLYGYGSTGPGRDHNGPSWAQLRGGGSLPSWFGGGASAPAPAAPGMPTDLTPDVPPAAGGGMFSGGMESPGLMGMLGGGLALMNASGPHEGPPAGIGSLGGAFGGGLLGGMMQAHGAKQQREDDERFNKMLDGFGGAKPTETAGSSPQAASQPVVQPQPGQPAVQPMPGEPMTLAAPMQPDISVKELAPPEPAGVSPIAKTWQPPYPRSKPGLPGQQMADYGSISGWRIRN